MLAIKLVLLVALLAAAVLGGAIPLRSGRSGEASRFLGLGNAFAAGIFLGAGLIHMLPDAAEAWRALPPDYPMAYLLCAVAIVALLLAEHVVLGERAHEAVHAPPAERFAHLVEHGQSLLPAYAVLTALSIHSFLAGLALGAQSELAGALVIFVAIAAHKSTAGFALGVSLVRKQMPLRRAWGLLWLFAAATPVGILTALLFDAALTAPAQRYAEATILALAAGTFAYVATFDILRDEFHEPHDRWSKWLCLTAGTAAMALLALWV